ncbi:hypothetical protein PTTG_29155 [Puccinia triticina 1-1 BBBD Race 1]|uniref:Uncharacterized protein n=2 Tax=Puccinia triticina TaxID=208348 RepID=A0A180G653_PUCT1|nr:uncharacterized protein PtA15_10A60 [Puccinia triticina]OAV88088.1 hypothetical protein PTTG_29155 [Puccinia triticina 1-1 BBBD Race 1]WAQ88641.1 hypothetical protein PtA15_10A60 [Puccinia triticina]WAR58718.1 hypothetical protein PtB15_10B57 [Puccinia triticina]
MYAVRLTPRCYVIPPAGSGSGWSPAQAHCPAIDHAHQQDPMATIIKPFELPSQDYEDFDPSAGQPNRPSSLPNRSHDYLPVLTLGLLPSSSIYVSISH